VLRTEKFCATNLRKYGKLIEGENGGLLVQ
jgi:hypothetical protein